MAGKAEIVDQIVNQVEGLTKRQAIEVFDAVFGAISDYLVEGDRVAIHGFGSFSISERAARQGRNPATSESIYIPASKNVRFKVGSHLKDRLGGGPHYPPSPAKASK